jgi:starch synthase
MPLIIKVASIPKERMQVYFIDNDEYFKKRGLHLDEKKKFYEDNDERAIFFAKGVIETVKKLNWSPDIIHVHGWMASLFPLYLKTYYKDEPVFENSKIVTSVYDKSFDESLNKKLVDKILFDEINEDLIKGLKDPSYNNLMKNAIDFSDAIILGSQEIPTEISDHLSASKKPILDYQTRETFSETYTEFYKNEVLNQ